MRNIGKIVGVVIGFLIGNVIGALIGLWLGFMFDRARANRFSMEGWYWKRASEEDRQNFFYATFAVMGHIAKASGQVTEAEIKVASAFMDRMQLFGSAREQAKQAFGAGKSADFPLLETLRQFRESCQDNRDLLRFFLEMQLQAAFADGQLHPKEREILHTVARALGFSSNELERLLSMIEAELRFFQRHRYQHSGQQGYQHQQMPPRQDELDDAYQLLGVEASASDDDVKKAYRKQMSKHHPDKLMAKGLPKEMLEMAKQKAQDIQAAWEMIKKSRNIR
ncbi:co-chaperone DjlA [Dongshaea marina]|uniref:co-chaperone DjlA n=1 Tax=Dongshaea marina TaxID=2047966 RepID=UPI000D3E1E9A|nr:co-chaperone DjlA [Dongshaea marina]